MPVAFSNRQSSRSVLMTHEGLISTPLENIPLNLPLPHPLFIKIAEKYVLFRQAGDLLTDQRVHQLGAQNVHIVHIRVSDWEKLCEMIEELVAKSDLESGEEKAAQLMRNMLYSYWHRVQENLTLDPTTFDKMVALCQKLPVAMRRNPILATKLLKRNVEPSLYLSNHQLNLTIYAVAIGIKRNLNAEQLKTLALGAMLSNVGNVKVSKSILLKEGKLTSAEWEMVRSHPSIGAAMLTDLNAAPDVVEVARQHHEREDGTGYEFGHAGKMLTSFSKIVSIADVYDAIISRRPWKDSKTPAEAIEELKAMHTKFDPEILSLATKR